MSTDDRRLQHPDAPLVEACLAYAALHRRIVAEPHAQRADPHDEPDVVAKSTAVERLLRFAGRLMRGIARLRTTTFHGHRARAAASVLWDDGDLLDRAWGGDVLEDAALASPVVDLLQVPKPTGEKS